MEKNYLTDTIFLQNEKIYYETGDKVKSIMNYNWHKILNDYGWEKLNLKWIKKLNNLMDTPYKNSLYGVLDCGGDGDCLFHCISYALMENNKFNTNLKYEITDLRKIVAEAIDIKKFNEIINIYKILKDSNDFHEIWDPYNISYDDFILLITLGGNNYWADNIIINILKEKLEINIIILNSNSITNEYNYYPLLYDYDEKLMSIILLYENEMHFKLVGYFNNVMVTLFDNNNIPKELIKLINNLR